MRGDKGMICAITSKTLIPRKPLPKAAPSQNPYPEANLNQYTVTQASHMAAVSRSHTQSHCAESSTVYSGFSRKSLTFTNNTHVAGVGQKPLKHICKHLGGQLFQIQPPPNPRRFPAPPHLGYWIILRASSPWYTSLGQLGQCISGTQISRVQHWFKRSWTCLENFFNYLLATKFHNSPEWAKSLTCWHFIIPHV